MNLKERTKLLLGAADQDVSERDVKFGLILNDAIAANDKLRATIGTHGRPIIRGELFEKSMQKIKLWLELIANCDVKIICIQFSKFVFLKDSTHDRRQHFELRKKFYDNQR